MQFIKKTRQKWYFVVLKGDLKLVPGEMPVFHYIDRRNKNQDSLSMMEKAQELAEALGAIRS